MNSKTTRIIVGIVVLGGAICAAVAYWPTTPDVKTATDEQLVEIVTSDAFSKLTSDQQRTVMDRMWEMRRDPERREALPDLTDEQRQQMRKNMRESFMRRGEEQALRFAAAPTVEEKCAILDETIDKMRERFAQMQKRRAEPGDGNNAEPRPPRGGGDGTRQRPAPSLDRVKDRVESISPEMKAFHQALMERMMERGLEMPRRGGPPR